jgi:hypothetical protein
MSRWIIAIAALLLLAGLASGIRANEAPPPVARPAVPALAEIPANLIVVVDDKAKEARLQIPQGLFQQGVRPQPRPERRGADAAPRVPTLLAGLALTAALVSGGFWLLRRGRQRFIAPVCLALAALTLTAFAVWANTPVPRPAPDKQAGPIPVAGPVPVTLNGKIVVEIVAAGDAVKLIVPREMAQPGAKAAPEK